MLTRRRLLATGSLAAMFATAPATLRAAEGASADLSGELAEIERRSGGRLGVAILDTGAGRRYEHRGGERFPMCSTFKFLACAATLARVDAGRDELAARVTFGAADLVDHSPVTKDHVGGEGLTLAALCEAALTVSDNTAANLIVARLGGPQAVTAYARSLGDSVTRLDRTEPTLNSAEPGDPRDTTTPAAMADDIRMLILGAALSEKSRAQLAAWMASSTTGIAKLRAGVPKDWRVVDKTGSGAHGSTNDIAVLWPPGRAALVACVYMTETKVPDAESDALFAAIARAVAAALADSH